jgi:RNA polymerase sigma factor for flagellar operon FliA
MNAPINHEAHAFVTEHRSFVIGIAKQAQHAFNVAGIREDLVAHGYVGLLQAHERFDASRNVPFKSFAYYRVRGAVVDGIRGMAHASRRVHERMQEAPEGTPRRVYEEAPGAEAISATSRPAPQSAEAALIEAEQLAHLRRLVTLLPEDERRLIRGTFFFGRELQEVADELGISHSWACRMRHRALQRLKNAMEQTNG